MGFQQRTLVYLPLFESPSIKNDQFFPSSKYLTNPVRAVHQAPSPPQRSSDDIWMLVDVEITLVPWGDTWHLEETCLTHTERNKS